MVMSLPTAKHEHTVNLGKPFEGLVARAGLNPTSVVRQYPTFHSAHTSGSGRRGFDNRESISVHKNLTMVERYSRQNGTPRTSESAMDKLEDRYHKSS